MTARVFVPLVGADGSAQQVFEALAGPTAPEAHPAKLTAQISELYDFGLYRIGQTVREAATRFSDVRRARVWLGRANARIRPWYLRISDLQVGRLSDENARSAGLGLTVAALLAAFARPHDIVFATGEILPSQAPGAVGGVAVGPVDGIRGKLTLVGDYLHQHRASLAGHRVHVLLPRQTVDGRALSESEARIIDRLGQVAREIGADLKVAHLDNLDDLEGLFGPFSADPIIGVRAAAALAVAGLAAGAAVFGYHSLTSAPVDLSWRPVESSAAAEPRRAIYRSASDRLELLPPCFDAQRQPVVVGGETLLIRVSAEDRLALSARLAPARFFIVSVSRQADPIVLDASLFRTAGGNLEPGRLDDAVAAIPVEAADDEIRLFVVATRDQTVSLSQLTDDLRQRLQGLDGAAVLATSAQFLKDRFDGQIDYQFKVTTDASLCTP